MNPSHPHTPAHTRALVRAPRPAWALVAGLALAAMGTAHAGRPLNVDDANVNDPGAGHLEAWYAKLPGATRTLNLAPAYAPVQGLELSAALVRDRTAQLNTVSVQGKFQLTPPQSGGCHQAAVLGVARPNGQRGVTPYLTGIATCEVGPGAVHMNLGANRAPGGPTLPTAGVAWEQAFGGLTGHLEWLVQRNAKPSLGLGLRTEIAKGVQIDGSVGRSGGENLYSVGMKFQF